MMNNIVFQKTLILVSLAGFIINSCASWKNLETAIVEPKTTSASDSAQPEEENINKDKLIGISSLNPYFKNIFEGDAAKALAEDRLEDALLGFDDIARQIEDPVLTPRARFLASFLAARLGDNARAVADMPTLAHQLPVVADTAWEIAATSALRLHKYDLAIKYASSISEKSEIRDEIIASAYRLSKNYEKAISAYRQFAQNWPKSTNLFEKKGRLVECIVNLSTFKKEQVSTQIIEEALKIITLMEAQSPRHKWTRFAVKLEKQLFTLIDEKPKKKKGETKAAIAAYDKALSLKHKMRHKAAEKAYVKVIKLARNNGSLKCRARLEHAEVVFRQRTYSRAADLFIETANDCSMPEIKIKALYKGAKNCMTADRFEESIDLFAQVEKEFSTHSYADDARLHAARCHLALGNKAKFLEFITSLPDLYPTGDMRSEALWTAAWHSIKQKDYESAHTVLLKYFETFPVEDGWYVAGRSGYWLGRVEQLLGKTDEAENHFEHVVVSSPLSYYMVLSHSRLVQINEPKTKKLIAKLAPAGGELTTRFKESLLTENKSFAYGVELMRLGLTTRGKKVFNTLLADSKTPTQMHWIVADLFRHMGQYIAERKVASDRSDEWKKRYPSGDNLMRWILAYPTAFQEEVAISSTESTVEPSLIYAVMREESGFNAKVESWANAMGLMQLIMPTAKSMAKVLGIKVNRKALKKPSINTRLGAAYLNYLSKKLDDRKPLMIAGYNAGEGAVLRWLKNKKNDDLDYFIEAIPYNQTRGYTKRVLSSLAVYKFLYDENRPVFTPNLKLP